MKPTLSTRLRLALLAGISRLLMRLLHALIARSRRTGKMPAGAPRSAAKDKGARVIDGEFQRVDAPHTHTPARTQVNFR